jgi:CMP-2-keto-3-deoxyoctulosonic acid synthetase
LPCLPLTVFEKVEKLQQLGVPAIGENVNFDSMQTAFFTGLDTVQMFRPNKYKSMALNEVLDSLVTNPQ